MLQTIVRLRAQVQLSALKVAATVLPLPKPLTLVGNGSSTRLMETIQAMGVKRLLVVSDRPLMETGLLNPMLRKLKQLKVEVSIYAGVTPDPTFSVVNEGLNHLSQSGSDAVLAVGGGSSIDAAKAIALAARNGCKPRKLIGVLKARRRGLPLFVVPTTAGTGSEVTIGAVISEDENHQKGLIIDPRLVPVATALDGRLMKNMPARVTAESGLDALTHAIEAWSSDFATEETDGYARAACRLIFEHLSTAVHRGDSLAAREAMATAAHYAGLALNQAGLGYVHGIAHQLGAFYGVPHGRANAIVLPHVMAFNRDACETRFAEIARYCGLASEDSGDGEATNALIESVRRLIAEVRIDTEVPGLQPGDFNAILRGAFAEAHGTYAVPRYMDYRQGRELLLML